MKKQTIQNIIHKCVSFLEKHDDLIVLLVGLALALILRLVLRGYVSGDTKTGAVPWYEYIQSQRGIPALAHNFSGYPPLYLYMLVAVYYVNQLVHVSPLMAIKSISIVFDFFAAFWVAKIVQVKYTSKTVSYSAALAFLFLPTVFINGAMWGQIDGIFTAFLLATLYYILRRRDVPAMIAFGLALSIKFQAIFLAPFLLVLLLHRRLSFASIFLAPAVLLATFLPSWAIGRPIMQMIMMYSNQVSTWNNLSMNAPTFYALIDNSVNYLFVPAGEVIAVFIVGLAVYAVYKLRTQLTADLLVYLSASSLFLIVYILPLMHERYFFPAEVFFLLVAFYRPRLAFITFGLQIAALATYDNYLFGKSFLTLSTDSLLMLAMLIYVLYDLSRQVFANRDISHENTRDNLISKDQPLAEDKIPEQGAAGS